MSRVILIALDSVGIEPHGHSRPDSVYAQSRFLFPRGHGGQPLELTASPIPGILVEAAVVHGADTGAFECAITYTSIFSGQSALERHGLMHGLGMKEQMLKEMVNEDNMFHRFAEPCLANALFRIHLDFLGSSHVQDLLPVCDRKVIELTPCRHRWRRHRRAQRDPRPDRPSRRHPRCHRHHLG
jgi:hypothetical protein